MEADVARGRESAISSVGVEKKAAMSDHTVSTAASYATED